MSFFCLTSPYITAKNSGLRKNKGKSPLIHETKHEDTNKQKSNRMRRKVDKFEQVHGDKVGLWLMPRWKRLKGDFGGGHVNEALR